MLSTPPKVVGGLAVITKPGAQAARGGGSAGSRPVTSDREVDPSSGAGDVTVARSGSVSPGGPLVPEGAAPPAG
jgi:hypothetical protein